MREYICREYSYSEFDALLETVLGEKATGHCDDDWGFTLAHQNGEMFGEDEQCDAECKIFKHLGCYAMEPSYCHVIFLYDIKEERN